MNWKVYEAKARFSELLKKTKRAPQVIKNRDEEVAVVLSMKEYQRLKSAVTEEKPKKTPMQEWLEWCERWRAETGGVEMELPPRTLDDDRPNPFEDEQ